MKTITHLIILSTFLVISAPFLFAQESDATIIAAIEATKEATRQGFKDYDLEQILKYHHEDVQKQMGFSEPIQVGRKGVGAAIESQHDPTVKIEFLDGILERRIISPGKDMVVEQVLFTIRGTPEQSDPWTYSGRVMLVWIRDEQSPTGWSNIHEMMQPNDGG